MKNCKNCAHRSGTWSLSGKCMKSGYYMEIQRKFPDRACDVNFSGWEPRPSVLGNIVNWIKK